MKLKSILIIFNSLILAAFGAVIALPAMFLGWSYTQVFWAESWYLIVLFIVVLIVLNVYFALNWRLFGALESENWPAVITVIEQRVTQRLRFNSANIRLLANAYVVTGQPQRISDLEQNARSHRPDVVRRNALLFGVPHLLSGDGAKTAAYFEEFRDSAPQRDLPMVRWSLAFGLLLDGKSERACELLEEQIRVLDPGVTLALSAYLLHVHAGEQEQRAALIAGARENLRSHFTHETWRKHLHRERTELHMLVLTKLLGDVEKWLFDDGGAR